MPLQEAEMLTPREAQLMQHEREENEANRNFQFELKKLDIELAKLEVKWTQLFKMPVTIIKLPIHVLFALALCISFARKHEPSESFWKCLR